MGRKLVGKVDEYQPTFKKLNITYWLLGGPTAVCSRITPLKNWG